LTARHSNVKNQLDEFSTYIFKENEIKTNNVRVNRERPYYIGILIFLISVVLYLLDFDYAIHFFVIGYIVLVIGQVTMSGRVPSIGHRPVTLKLTKDSVYIGKERLEIKNKEDVDIRIIGYKGQGINQRTAFYQAHNGNDNLMKIKYGDKVTEFKFVLDSETHKDKLVRFCEQNGFEI
jgi:hypothetical protein